MATYNEALEASKEYFEGDELAAQVFLGKYALTTPDGDILEKTPKDMHVRLAKEFARIEEKYPNPMSVEEIFDLLDKFRYVIPQGSPMAGVGNPHQTMSLSNCVHGESLVYTKEHGLVKMRNIVPGLHVLTHKSRFRKVLRHWSNGQKETYTIIRSFSNKQVSVRTEQEMGRFCAVTPDHRIQIDSGEWKTVESLLGKHNKALSAPTLTVLNTQGTDLSVLPMGLGRTVLMDETIAWIFGLYLAEGAIKSTDTESPSVYFTLAKDEMNLADRISTWSEVNLGHKAWIQTWDGLNFIQVNMFDKFFGRFILDNFGHGFDKKRLPEWVFALPKAIRVAFLDGFMTGDATNYEDLDAGYNVFSIANPTLAYELGLLARSIGKKVRFNFQATGKLIKHRTVTVSMSIEKEVIKLVKSPVTAEVFDMEVEEDHSFVAGDIVCHNCFVIESPYDSYSGILKTDQEEAQIMKRRGGVGFDISTIRPKGLKTNNAAKTTDGIGVFMERFSNTCREVAQGGRRGALMLSISVHHPEIETFINIKRNLDKVTGANVSIRLSDEFMQAVRDNKDVQLRWPVDSKEPKVSQMANAGNIWNQIIESAHACAEPGLLFWDTIERETPTHCYPEFKSTSLNPCGELMLSPYDSCRLLLVNTLSFVKSPFTSRAKFDYETYSRVVRKAQRLMDDLIDLEIECVDKILKKIDADPEPRQVKQIEIDLWNNIRKMCAAGRRTGLGVTAIGDTIAALGIRYGSEESIEAIEDIYKNLTLNAYRSTVTLAKERGAFPAFDYQLEKDHSFLNRVMSLDPELASGWKKYGRRNIGLTTTAPAGSVSILAQTTSGIEPAFEIAYKRRKKINPNDKEARIDFKDALGDAWQEYTVYHHGFKRWMSATGKTNIEESPYFKARANDIDWVNKVKAQAAAQKWICHSISNTTNIPADTSVDIVKDIYMTGWLSGCKGVTIYRDGSRSGVLVANESEKPAEENKFIEHQAVKRPKELPCEIHSVSVKGEKWTFFVGILDGRPYEIMGGLSKFINIPKRVTSGKIIKHNGLENPIARYDLHYDFERGPEDEAIIRDITSVFENATHAAFTRTISLALRHGAPVHYVVEQIVKGSEKEDDLFSFSKAASRVLKNYIKDGIRASGKTCSNCGASELAYQEGCLQCKSCGYSKCG